MPRKTGTSLKFKGFIMTLFTEEPPTLHEDMKCLITQREVCPTTGRLHWQTAFLVKAPNGLVEKTVRKWFPDVHIEGMIGTWERNVKYCSKTHNEDGTEARHDMSVEPIILGDVPKEKKEKKQKGPDLLLKVYEMARSGASVMEIADAYPAVYMRNHNAVAKVIEMFKLPSSPIVHVYFIIPKQVFPPNKVLIFTGETNIGKTAYAKFHFICPLLVSNIEDLRSFDYRVHDGIIFDDCDVNHMPRTTQIHLCDMEEPRSIYARFANIVIPANTKKIFTCNYGKIPVNLGDSAIARRCQLIDLGNKNLF